MENGTEGRAIEIRSIEVRYAGVVVGRSTKVRDWDGTGAFIGFAEPLPSGTSVVLRGDGLEQAARVVEVFESANPAVAGMQVKFVGAAEAARPAPKPVAAAAKSPVTTAPAAAAPAVAAATPAAATASAAPSPVTPAEASPVEASDAGSDAASSAVVAEQADGEAGPSEPSGQPGLGGKRRRRRR